MRWRACRGWAPTKKVRSATALVRSSIVPARPCVTARCVCTLVWLNADACAMVSLVYPDEALTFVPVENALSTAGSAVGTPAPAPSPAALPAPAALTPLADASCGGCLRDVFLELDIQVRHG